MYFHHRPLDSFWYPNSKIISVACGSTAWRGRPKGIFDLLFPQHCFSHPVHDLFSAHGASSWQASLSKIRSWTFWSGWASLLLFTPKTYGRFLHTAPCVLTLWRRTPYSSSYYRRCQSPFGLQKSHGWSRVQHVRASRIISRQWWPAPDAFLTSLDIRSYRSVGFVHQCATALLLA